jgi:tetratricopeptide (TPR) repeat protein
MRYILVLSIWLLVTACQDSAEAPGTVTGPELFAADIGDVEFPVSCLENTATMVQRGLALLHHMMYEEARLMFGMAANLEPSCAMAYWGQAMTWVHPLWPDRPSQQELAIGRELLTRAEAAGPPTNREAGYIRATRSYFDALPGDTEADRLQRFDRAWAEVALQNPDDLELRALAALAHIATAAFDDKSYVIQARAATMVQSILEQIPDHPGAHHYYIHAFDNPAHAAAALSIADRYGALTPVVPHATHMMTHIYTRLGQWRKSVEWNRKSADAAWEICTDSGEISSHYTHALDYLAYAYLQMGRDDAALAAVNEATTVEGPFSELNPIASAYALAAMPARYALERRDWEMAASLAPRAPADFPWGPEHAPYEAITHFAQALGHAHLGEVAVARTSVGELQRIAESLRSSSPYWAKQVDIQAYAAAAWTAQADGDEKGALVAMQIAADLETSTEKSPVTPGEVLPAQELLGDLLLAQGHPVKALEAYRMSLARSPRRLNSVLGAMHAAQSSGRAEDAVHYRDELLEFVDPATPRPEVASLAIHIAGAE